jgi:hypothetical protein
MNGRRTVRGLPLVGVAFGGVLLGHWLSYLLAMPRVRVRDVVLAATGHAYWLTAVKQAVVLAVISLAAMAMRQFRLVRRGQAPDHPGPASLAIRLAGLQILGFVALEVTERVVADAPISSLLAHHVLILGLLVQILIASSLALALSLFTRVVGAVARTLAHARFPRATGRSFPRPLVTVLRPVLVTGSVGPRSPPSQ